MEKKWLGGEQMLCHVYEIYEGGLDGGSNKGRITTAIDCKERHTFGFPTALSMI